MTQILTRFIQIAPNISRILNQFGKSAPVTDNLFLKAFYFLTAATKNIESAVCSSQTGTS